MSEFWRKLRRWRQRDSLAAELQEEITAHLEMKIADTGSSAAARRQFGNTALILEDARHVWGWPAVEALWQDLRYGFRMLLKAPGFTTVAGLSFAPGIGFNTANFRLAAKMT